MTKKQLKIRVKELKHIPANKLVPHPKNVREHPVRQVQAFQKVLDSIGFAGALVVRSQKDGTYQVLDGHLRAGMLEEEKLPCLVVDLNNAEAELFVFTYDTVALEAVIDMTAVLAHLEALSKPRKAVAEFVLDVDKVQKVLAEKELLDRAESELRGESFAAGVLQERMEESAGVPLMQERVNFWVYCDMGTMDDPQEAERIALEILGTGRSRQIDPVKFMEALALYAKKHGIDV